MRDCCGRTPLHWACRAGHLEIVQTLLQGQRGQQRPQPEQRQQGRQEQPEQLGKLGRRPAQGLEPPLSLSLSVLDTDMHGDTLLHEAVRFAVLLVAGRPLGRERLLVLGREVAARQLAVALRRHLL